jgi:hypothetical protein
LLQLGWRHGSRRQQTDCPAPLNYIRVLEAD